MTEEYVTVFGVAATGIIALAMVVIIALFTAMTRLMRKSEAMDGATTYLLP